jgi:hypothetical protein
VPFLGIQQANASRQYYGGTRLTTDSNQLHNGVIEVNVVNSLVSPSVDSDIRINVFVSAGEDFKWGRPNPDKMRNLHYFPENNVVAASRASEFSPQSGEAGDLSGTTGDSATDRPTQADPIESIGCEADDDQMMNVFFGEMPTSLREIFRRYVYQRTWIPSAAGSDEIVVSNLRVKSFPFHSGDDPEGLDLKADGNSYTQVTTSPIAFFAPCYAGWRGSLRHKWFFSNGDQSPNISQYGFIANNGFQNNTLSVTTDAQAQRFLAEHSGKFSNGGTASTNLGINNTIETEMPYYNGTRLSSARILGADSQSSLSYQVVTTQYTAAATGPTPEVITRDSYQQWVAAGEDFTLFFWTGVPIMYNYARTSSS